MSYIRHSSAKIRKQLIFFFFMKMVKLCIWNWPVWVSLWRLGPQISALRDYWRLTFFSDQGSLCCADLRCSSHLSLFESPKMSSQLEPVLLWPSRCFHLQTWIILTLCFRNSRNCHEWNSRDSQIIKLTPTTVPQPLSSLRSFPSSWYLT